MQAKAVIKHLRLAGAKGGRQTSPAKAAASRANAEKARLARLAKMPYNDLTPTDTAPGQERLATGQMVA